MSIVEKVAQISNVERLSFFEESLALALVFERVLALSNVYCLYPGMIQAVAWPVSTCGIRLQHPS